MPLVSVVIPVRNGEAYLGAALDSVFSQTLQDIEVLVVNDHSTDETAEILSNIRDPRLKVLTMSSERGLVAALNTGIAHSRSEFVARMDADDSCFCDRFERQVNALRVNQNAIVVYGDAISFIFKPGEPGSRAIRSPTPSVLSDALRLLRPGPTIVHPTVMMRKAAILKVGGYREFPHAEDRDLWLRLMGRGEFVQVNKPILHYRINDKGISRTHRASQAASRLLAVICWEIKNEQGFDVYAEFPEILTELHPVLEKLLRDDDSAFLMLARLRIAVRERRFAKALAAAFQLATTNRWALSTRLRLGRERAIALRYLEVLKNDALLRTISKKAAAHPFDEAQ